MALETLKGIKEINGEKVIVMDDLREQHPEMFNEAGAMDYARFEKEIRPNYPIQIRHDKNSISFTIQNGPIKEVGKNGCQVTALIDAACSIIRRLNSQFPCEENDKTVGCLVEALMWQKKRTEDREARGVEGTSNA